MTNTTNHPDAFGGGAFDALVKHVSRACSVEEFVINREILQKTVQGHSQACVYAAIEAFASECFRNRWKSTKAPETRVGLLVSRLKGLAAATEPTEADLQAFRSAQVKQDPIKEKWESLVGDYRLDELPEIELKALKKSFLEKFRHLGLEHLQVFCCDLPWGFGDNKPEDLCREMPEAQSRADHFRKMMEERG